MTIESRNYYLHGLILGKKIRLMPGSIMAYKMTTGEKCFTREIRVVDPNQVVEEITINEDPITSDVYSRDQVNKANIRIPNFSGWGLFLGNETRIVWKMDKMRVRKRRTVIPSRHAQFI